LTGKDHPPPPPPSLIGVFFPPSVIPGFIFLLSSPPFFPLPVILLTMPEALSSGTPAFPLFEERHRKNSIRFSFFVFRLRCCRLVCFCLCFFFIFPFGEFQEVSIGLGLRFILLCFFFVSSPSFLLLPSTLHLTPLSNFTSFFSLSDRHARCRQRQMDFPSLFFCSLLSALPSELPPLPPPSSSYVFSVFPAADSFPSFESKFSVIT